MRGSVVSPERVGSARENRKDHRGGVKYKMVPWKTCPARVLGTFVEESRESADDFQATTERMDVALFEMGMAYSEDRMAVVKFFKSESEIGNAGEFMIKIRLWGRHKSSFCARVGDLAFYLDEREGVVYMEAGTLIEEREGSGIVFGMRLLHGAEDLDMFRRWAGAAGSLY